MKLLTVGGGVYLTGSAIADAVLRYGLALSKRRDVDIVEIPYVAEYGDVRRAEFTIGWRHKVQAVTQAFEGEELVEVGTTFALDERTAATRIARGLPFTAEEAAELNWAEPDGDPAI